jgi:oxazoline/thiazoline synthase
MDVDAAARPRFKACVQPIISSDNGLFLLSEDRRAWIPDPIYSALAPMLDGAHDVEAIFEALSDVYPVEQVFAALDRLRTAGYLAEDTAAEARPTMAFWEHAGVSPSLARSRLERTLVSTVAIGNVDVGFLTELLGCQGVNVAREGNFAVVVTDDYLRPELAEWNTRSLTSGKAWLLAKPVGIETWIGPLFVPGQTACWECLAQRLRGHRKLEEYIAHRNGTDARLGAVHACIASTWHAPLAEIATQVTRWIGTGGQSSLLNRVVSTSVLTLERVHHPLTRRPQCPSCGSTAPNNDVVPKPVRLRRSPKAQTLDEEHHALNQREVLRQLEIHLSPITGIVNTLLPGERSAAANGNGGCLTPIFAADHNFSDAHDEQFILREGQRRRSGGKGKSIEQARVSALAESLERYCGVFDGTEPRVRATFAELGAAAIHPNACMGYSERQYAQREAHNRRGRKVHWVPEPFRGDVAIEWSPLWSLTREVTRYLPTSYCYYGYRSVDPVFARGDSNGCAAGYVLEQAVLYGFLELVERDAVALWWYNRLRRRAVNLDSVEDSYIRALKKHYGELKRDIWVLDVTSDLGIATFAAISRRTDTTEEDIIYGFGAHLDPGIALTRALTELNQSLEAVPAINGPDLMRSYRGNEDSIRWWRTVKVADANYLIGSPDAGSLQLEDFQNLASDDLHQDIVTCKELARLRGIDILVLEQTRPDVGLPVVRVVAPGLRHFWPRFGPGRLYDVPTREGWQSRPLSEDELNPFAIEL